ncbi:Arc family DNA-binding protein [Bordetella bronchialis]|nr:Arc family DNA-binding protein [Bordetella bronchialis]
MTKPRQPFPSEAADKFVLRLPDGLRDQIAEAAKKSGRSMNAEFIHRIQLSLLADAAEVNDVESTQLDLIQAKMERVNELLDIALEKAQKARSRNNKKPPKGGDDQ